jgi:hypothetical protein
MSPAADIALLPLVSLQLPQKKETDARNLEKVRTAAARYPDDPWAKRARAIAEAISGDRQAAASLLDAELVGSPEDPVLLRWRAAIYKPDRPNASAADITGARRLLVRAHKADPSDWLVLSDYIDTFLARREPIPEHALDTLILAHELAPQVSELAMKAGIQLAVAGYYPLAIAAISPVVNNPHYGSDMLLERGLLDALQTGKKADVEAALQGLSLGRGSAIAISNMVNMQH